VINVVEAVTTGDILYQVNETLPIVRDILRDVQRLTQGPVQDIARRGAKLGGAELGCDLEAAQARRWHCAGCSLLTSGPSANDDLQGSIANVREVTEGLRDLVGKGSTEVDSTGAKLRQNLDKLASAVESLNHALGNVEHITGDIRKGKGTVGRLLVDDAIANNVESDDLKTPRELVRGISQLQTIVGLRSRVLHRQQRVQKRHRDPSADAARQVLSDRAAG
jgi:hypothetical protein